ncbi:hypothetical protein ACP4OV_029843 [Aristida adscensionis]
MDSEGVYDSPSDLLTLTMATPGTGAGTGAGSIPNRPSSSVSMPSGGDGSNNEGACKVLALLDTINLPRGGGEDTGRMEEMEMAAAGGGSGAGGSSSQLREFIRFSQEQLVRMEEAFQEKNFPDKGTKVALAESFKVKLRKVDAWFVNRRVEEAASQKESNKMQVETLTSENSRLRRKIARLKQSNKKLKSRAEEGLVPRL